MQAKINLAWTLIAKGNFPEAFDTIQQIPSERNQQAIRFTGTAVKLCIWHFGRLHPVQNQQLTKTIKENPENNYFAFQLLLLKSASI